MAEEESQVKRRVTEMPGFKIDQRKFAKKRSRSEEVQGNISFIPGGEENPYATGK